MEVLAEALWLKNDPIAPFPTELPLTRPTGLSVTMVGLERARLVKGMVDILADALWLKNYHLAPFPTELNLTGPTRLLADKVRLERAIAGEGMAEVLAKALWLKNDPLSPLHPTELPMIGPTGLFSGHGWPGDGQGGRGGGGGLAEALRLKK